MNRFLLALTLTLFLTPTANAEGPDLAAALTEHDVVTRALARPAVTDVIAGEVAIEEGQARAASAYPNPQLSYMREHTFGSLGTAEDYLTAAQTIDLGNRRGLRGEAGEARARAARWEAEASRLLIAAEARTRFYDVIYRQERTVALARWVEHIAAALAIVTRREQRGDAAAYDRRRLERERAVAAGRLEMEHAALERAIARLHGLLAMEERLERLRLTGTLLPDIDEPAPSAMRVGRDRPTLLALDLRIQASAYEMRAASRWWLPDLRLEGGWKGVDLRQQGRSDGFLLGASLFLPLWDQSSGLARIAEGQARAARGRRQLRASELEAELSAARTEAVRLRRAAANFSETNTAASTDLMRMATAGYEGGELGLLELVDAYRGAAEDGLTALDMGYAARRARIELDRLLGAGLP